jgi:hypothetical protein
MTDRDSHRHGDPLHDTHDESDAAPDVVIDPDHTPVQDIVERIAGIVGEMDASTRGRLAESIGGHDKRVRTRGANMALEAVAEVRRETQPDMQWATFEEVRAELAECRKERESRAKWRKVIWGSGIFSGASVLALLTWIATSLDARADAAAQERLRIEMLKEHETVIQQFKAWRPLVNHVTGLSAPGVP